jgi:shikimate kinase
VTRRHLLLVGLPGSGKTTVGALVAQALAAEFVDVDRAIEAREQLAVADLFAQRGEGEFRRLERRQVEATLSGPAAVIAPGGGWAAQPGNWESLAGRALTVFLATRPEVAAARAAPAGTRPLLAGGEPVARMRELLAARERYYQRADAAVTTDDRSVADVAQAVLALARSRGGW